MSDLKRPKLDLTGFTFKKDSLTTTSFASSSSSASSSASLSNISPPPAASSIDFLPKSGPSEPKLTMAKVSFAQKPAQAQAQALSAINLKGIYSNPKQRVVEQTASDSKSGKGMVKTSLSMSTSPFFSSMPASIPTSSSSSSSPSPSVPKPSLIAGKSAPAVKVEFVVISKGVIGLRTPYTSGMAKLLAGFPEVVYDKKKALWTFPFLQYVVIGEAIQQQYKGCEMTLLPKNVVSVLGLTGDHAELSSIQVFNDNVAVTDLKDMIPGDLWSRLLPFQKEGVAFAVSKRGRTLIADDMGLGKTIQAVAIACCYRYEWPCLVITPSSLRHDWAEAFKKWAGSAVDPWKVKVIEKTQELKQKASIFIISYTLATNAIEELQKKLFKVIIADESHQLKNQLSKRGASLVPLIQKADRAILLSGTPAFSKPLELYSQVSAINEKIFPDFHQYTIRYCGAHRNKFNKWDMNGHSNLTELQLMLEKAVLIRRVKNQVLTLPPKKRDQIFLSISDEDKRKLSQALGKFDVSTIQWDDTEFFAEAEKEENLEKQKARRRIYVQLWQDTGDAKIPALLSYISHLLENPEAAGGRTKFLVFAYHTNVIEAVAGLLGLLAVDFIRIDGKTPGPSRFDLCRKFQTTPQCRVALLSLTAANVGLTLHSASLVLFAELFWNPGHLLQAEDRVHRIGQQHEVEVRYLLAQDTLDDRIWPMLQKKLVVLDMVGLNKKEELEVGERQKFVSNDPEEPNKASDQNLPSGPPEAVNSEEEYEKDLLSFEEEAFLEAELEGSVPMVPSSTKKRAWEE